jgi:hypothetical protein
MRQISELKICDKVVIYDKYSSRINPVERVVSKIGRQFIYVSNGNYDTIKFNIENGYGKYGETMFPGSIEEYNEYISLNDYRRNILKQLEKVIYFLSKEELDNIMHIISNNS